MRISTKSSSGSALIISLVILTGVTLAAILSMERSGLQSRMVGNMQIKQDVWQGAYTMLSSGFDQFINNPNTGTRIIDVLNSREADANGIPTKDINDQFKQLPVNYFADPNTAPKTPEHAEADADVKFDRKRSTPTGYSIGKFATFHFSARAEVNDSSSFIASAQEMGFHYVGPNQ